MALNTDQIEQLKPIMQKYGDKAITDMVAILLNAGKLATGTLVSSFRAEVTETLKLIVSFEDYGKYVQYGRRPGKFAPPQVIDNWCRIKGIDPKYSYAINFNIFKYGITPTDFYSAFFKNINGLEKEIVNTMGEDILKELKYMIENEGKTYTGKKGV